MYAPQMMMWPQQLPADPWLGPRVALPPPGPAPPSMNAIEGERAELEILASRLATRIEELSASLAVLDVLDERLSSAQATERAASLSATSDQVNAKAALSAMVLLARDYDVANKAATELRALSSVQREKIAELTNAVGRLTTDVTDRSAGERPREEAVRKATETIALLRSELAAAEAAKSESNAAKEKMRRDGDLAREAAQEARSEADRERNRRQAAETRLDNARAEADAASTTAAESIRAADLVKRRMQTALSDAEREAETSRAALETTRDELRRVRLAAEAEERRLRTQLEEEGRKLTQAKEEVRKNIGTGAAEAQLRKQLSELQIALQNAEKARDDARRTATTADEEVRRVRVEADAEVRKSRSDIETQVRRVRHEAEEAIQIAQLQRTATAAPVVNISNHEALRSATEEVHRLKTECSAAKEHNSHLQAECQRLQGALTQAKAQVEQLQRAPQISSVSSSQAVRDALSTAWQAIRADLVAATSPIAPDDALASIAAHIRAAASSVALATPPSEPSLASLSSALASPTASPTALRKNSESQRQVPPPPVAIHAPAETVAAEERPTTPPLSFSSTVAQSSPSPMATVSPAPRGPLGDPDSDEETESAFRNWASSVRRPNMFN